MSNFMVINPHGSQMEWWAWPGVICPHFVSLHLRFYDARAGMIRSRVWSRTAGEDRWPIWEDLPYGQWLRPCSTKRLHLEWVNSATHLTNTLTDSLTEEQEINNGNQKHTPPSMSSDRKVYSLANRQTHWCKGTNTQQTVITHIQH